VGGALCTSIGWCRLANTTQRSVCPDPNTHGDLQANEGCGGGINGWGGGHGGPRREPARLLGGGPPGEFWQGGYSARLAGDREDATPERAERRRWRRFQ